MRKRAAKRSPPRPTGRIVTFGINPTFPATNYGYIRPGARLDGGTAFAVDSFVEKPDAATAGRYIADRYLWNSGNFLFRADVMLAEIARFEPDIAKAAKAAVGGMTKDLDFLRLPAEAFAQVPKKSIDYAVMERTGHAAVLPVDCGWSDVGSWSAVWDLMGHNADGNAAAGSVVFLDSRNSLAHSDGAILTAVVGVDNLVVVATPDAVLVTSRDKAEQVKDLVEQLKAQGREQAVTHVRVYRPWGYYQGVDAGSRYQVKRIVVKPNAMLSLQKHFHRSEHWVVVRGVAEVTIGSEARTIHENEIDLHPDRQRPSPCQSRHDTARTDRGSGRQLSRRRRHRASHRPVRPQLTSRHSAAVGWRLRWSKRRSNTCSAMRFFKISTEPPAIIQPRVRRMQYSTSVSRENPMAPMICTASLATSKPAWLHATLAIAVS